MSTVRKAVLIGIGGAGLWAGVITLSTNYQKANSPLVRDVLFTLRNTPQVKQSLGDDLEPGFWFSGSINQFKGRADLQFSLQGSLNRGEVTLKAHRRGPTWTIDQLVLAPHGQPAAEIGDVATSVTH